MLLNPSEKTKKPLKTQRAKWCHLITTTSWLAVFVYATNLYATNLYAAKADASNVVADNSITAESLTNHLLSDKVSTTSIPFTQVKQVVFATPYKQLPNYQVHKKHLSLIHI